MHSCENFSSRQPPATLIRRSLQNPPGLGGQRRIRNARRLHRKETLPSTKYSILHGSTHSWNLKEAQRVAPVSNPHPMLGCCGGAVQLLSLLGTLPPNIRVVDRFLSRPATSTRDSPVLTSTTRLTLRPIPNTGQASRCIMTARGHYFQSRPLVHHHDRHRPCRSARDRGRLPRGNRSETCGISTVSVMIRGSICHILFSILEKALL